MSLTGLAVPTVADRYLEAGRLCACFDLRAPTGADYNLVFPSETVRRRPDVRAFARWMKQETQRSGVRFAQLLNRGASPSPSDAFSPAA